MTLFSPFLTKSELSKSCVSNNDSLSRLTSLPTTSPSSLFSTPLPSVNTSSSTGQPNSATTLAQLNLLSNLNTLFQPTIFSSHAISSSIKLDGFNPCLSPINDINKLALSSASVLPFASCSKKLSLLSVPKSNSSPSVSTSIETSSQTSETSLDRLTRNRQTARLRRERKKHEAESLTIALSEQQNLFRKLQSEVSDLDKEEAERVQKILKTALEKGKTPRGCLFCDKNFNSFENKSFEEYLSEGEEKEREKVEQVLLKHYHSEHSSELKANSLSFGPSFDILKIISKNSLENLTFSNANNKTIIAESISNEEKRKKRLEKNAQSAKLCRQRKKLYIQSIRLELPELSFKNKLLQYLLKNKPEKTILSSEKSVEKEIKIPKLSGWDHTQKRYKKRTCSETSFESDSKKLKTEKNTLETNYLLKLLLLNSLNSNNVNNFNILNNFAWKTEETKLPSEIEVAKALFSLSAKSE